MEAGSSVFRFIVAVTNFMFKRLYIVYAKLNKNIFKIFVFFLHIRNQSYIFVRRYSYIKIMELKPTESELEILQVIWKKGQCTVRDVHEELAKNKDAGYTTTLKLMQIMHDKGLVERDTTAKTHLYKALISREQAQSSAIDKIINTVFKGSTADLVIQALGQHRASTDELDAIREYLKQFKGQE
jgi:BlaI family penicillinase repressor